VRREGTYTFPIDDADGHRTGGADDEERQRAGCPVGGALPFERADVHLDRRGACFWHIDVRCRYHHGPSSARFVTA